MRVPVANPSSIDVPLASVETTDMSPAGPIYAPARTSADANPKININLHGLELLYPTFSGMRVTPFECARCSSLPAPWDLPNSQQPCMRLPTRVHGGRVLFIPFIVVARNSNKNSFLNR